MLKKKTHKTPKFFKVLQDESKKPVKKNGVRDNSSYNPCIFAHFFMRPFYNSHIQRSAKTAHLVSIYSKSKGVTPPEVAGVPYDQGLLL